MGKNITVRMLLSTLILLIVPALALAVPVPIDQVGHQVSGPFMFSLFHDASGPDPGSGTIMAWMEESVTLDSSFDPDTGDLLLNLDLFADSGLSSFIGTVTGVGSFELDEMTVVDETTPGTGDVIGTIAWTFDLQDSTLRDHLLATVGLGPISTSFLDRFYAVSSTGLVANSWTGSVLTLWGADGLQGAKFSQSNLGVDLVIPVGPQPPIDGVPEPQTTALFLLGAGVLLAGILRGQRNRAGIATRS